MRVCLASTSPARLMLLRQAGIEPLTVSPDVDEDAVTAAAEAERGASLPPAELVLLLARAKAAAVTHGLADEGSFDGLVIGGGLDVRPRWAGVRQALHPGGGDQALAGDARSDGHPALRALRVPGRSRLRSPPKPPPSPKPP